MALDDKQKEEIGQFIKEYLIQNPEIMLDVQNALQAKQEAARTQASAEAVAANKKAIFSDSGDMILGALLDAGLPLDTLRARLAMLNIRDFALDAAFLVGAVESGLAVERVEAVVGAEQYPAFVLVA